MDKQITTEIREPADDDRRFWDIVMGIYGYQAVLLAHELGLFSLLAERPGTLDDICGGLNIERRPAGIIMNVCISLGLVDKTGDSFTLTKFSRDYLIKDSPTYFGGFLDYSIKNQHVFSFNTLKKAVLSNSSQVYGGTELYASHEAEAERARDFTRMMHSHSMAPALAWPKKLDLAVHKVILDIGGGSGAHSIGATLQWPKLTAVVLDLPPVCEVAEGYVKDYDLTDRIKAVAGNMWSEPFPPADIHFYADIFHDFPPDKCAFLAGKSFENLEPGGRIIIHEMLYNEEKTAPFTVAGYDVSMLLWTEGQQFSGPELSSILSNAGFKDIEVIPTFGYWGIVTGRKPV